MAPATATAVAAAALPPASPLESAAGLVSLLEETDDKLVHYALVRLDALVNTFWCEISDALIQLEVLSEKKNFEHRRLAGLLAAKTHYHLGALDEATLFALGAGDLFDLNYKSEFVETIIAQCIDKYIAGRRDPNSVSKDVVFWKQLQTVIENIFNRCFKDSEYKQAIGIAIDSKRIDVIEKAVLQGDARELLQYLFKCCVRAVSDRNFRSEILRLIVKSCEKIAEPDYFTMVTCFVMLNDHEGCAKTLNSLVQKSDIHALCALQAAFDIEEIASQDFRVLLSRDIEAGPFENPLRNIISGFVRSQLNADFLNRNNHADMLIVKSTRSFLDGRSSLQHSALTFANAFTFAGTAHDQFLRESLDWLLRANNWCKFSATAALGVIHMGHVTKSMKLLRPYLPFGGVSDSTNPAYIYSEGGALFALGLLHTNNTSPLPYFMNTLSRTTSEVLQHGGCLGIGCSAMATADEKVVAEMHGILETDNAVSSDAAALAIGMVMTGTGSHSKVAELLAFAHQTQHERIIRSLGLASAFIMLGQEDNAKKSIEQFVSDTDALVRYGGVYMIALAYAGSGNITALRQLLHIAVSDVDDNVRRAAITAIGYLFLDSPQSVPPIVEQFIESYNPYMRYGSCMALGIAGASTNSQDSIALLGKMKTDSVDFVRQGALIAQSFIQIQQGNASQFRETLAQTISDKRETQMCKFGAVVSQGILDAGGRNCCISLRSREGLVNVPAVIGMTLFLQYWNWFPLTHFFALTLRPTALIGLDKELRVPKFTFISKAKPSMFAYPVRSFTPVQEKVERMQVVLSTSAKALARARRRGSAPAPRASGAKNSASTSSNSSSSAATFTAAGRNTAGSAATSPAGDLSAVAARSNAMEIDITDEKQPLISQSQDESNRMDIEETVDTAGNRQKQDANSAEGVVAAGSSGAGVANKKREPSSESKQNMSRVLPAQEKFISFTESDYQPVKKTRMSGVLIVQRVTVSDLKVSPTSESQPQNFIQLTTSLVPPERIGTLGTYDFLGSLQAAIIQDQVLQNAGAGSSGGAAPLSSTSVPEAGTTQQPQSQRDGNGGGNGTAVGENGNPTNGTTATEFTMPDAFDYNFDNSNINNENNGGDDNQNNDQNAGNNSNNNNNGNSNNQESGSDRNGQKK